MKKKAAILIFFAGVVFSLLGADCIGVLDKINNRLEGIKTIRGNFTEIMKSTILNQEIKEEGNFLIKKGGIMRFDYKEPAGKWAVSDGLFTYLYDPDSNIVYKHKISEAADPFLTLFQGENLLKSFKCNSIEETEGADILVLEVFDKSLPFSNLKLIVSKKGIPFHISYLDSVKNNIEIALDSIEIDKPVSGERFKVRVPKRARVISLE